MGGLHKFMVWDKPIPDRLKRIPGILSCRPSKNQKEEREFIPLHVNWKKDLYGPESMQIQSNLASTVRWPSTGDAHRGVADRRYVQNSMDRTARWPAAIQR